MTQYRISQAATLLGVSDDTVRRWLDDGRLVSVADSSGRKVVEGRDLAAFAQARASEPESSRASSARNRFTGLVTAVKTDAVMAQVDLQCGPFRVVSVMTTEAVHDLGIEVGSTAVAVVKATTVIVEGTGVS